MPERKIGNAELAYSGRTREYGKISMGGARRNPYGSEGPNSMSGIKMSTRDGEAAHDGGIGPDGKKAAVGGDMNNVMGR